MFRTLLAALLLGGLPSHAVGQTLDEIELEAFVGGFDSPVAVTHAGDSRLFVSERAGRVQIVDNGVRLATPFLDIESRVRSGGEQGLLSVAFHPAFASNRQFFVNYTNLRGDTVVSRFQVTSNDPNRADPGSERILLTVSQPFSNHNGGQLQFGPDGLLYIGMGDGGSGDDPQCLSQKADTLLGKMLRIDVDQNQTTPPFYGIPANNPFVGSPSMPDEVLAVGLRNPWRFSFDRQTGDLYIGDVGQGRREEIDLLLRQDSSAPRSGGYNFGWKVMEGTLCNSRQSCPGSVPACGSPAFETPILEYSHSLGCSVTGGYVYRGSSISALFGRYLYGDFCSGTVWAARRSGNAWSSEPLPLEVSRLSAFGEDESGELYLVSLDGTLYRLRSTSSSSGSVQFREGLYEVREGEATVRISIERTGGSDGEVSVTLASEDDSAFAGEDYEAFQETVVFAAGESGTRRVEIPILDDRVVESSERFAVVLSSPSAGLGLGERSRALVEIEDDDVEIEPCVPSQTVLCINDGRFRVEASWQDFAGGAGQASAVPLTDDSGYFWFFENTNVELVVKVLDGCLLFDRFWVFAAGLTNVQVALSVTDTETGVEKSYENSLGQTFAPIQDVAAFATCP